MVTVRERLFWNFRNRKLYKKPIVCEIANLGRFSISGILKFKRGGLFCNFRTQKSYKITRSFQSYHPLTLYELHFMMLNFSTLPEMAFGCDFLGFFYFPLLSGDFQSKGWRFSGIFVLGIFGMRIFPPLLSYFLVEYFSILYEDQRFLLAVLWFDRSDYFVNDRWYRLGLCWLTGQSCFWY